MDFEIEEELPPPETGIRVVYLGPVSPHWDIQGLFGEQAVVDEFRRRTMARLQLLPPHDPQFRRNRERVNRDAERENLHLEWDLGVPEEDEVGLAFQSWYRRDDNRACATRSWDRVSLTTIYNGVVNHSFTE